MTISLPIIMGGLAFLSAVTIAICLSININNECSDVSMNHSLGYLMSVNSAILAMCITFFTMDGSKSSAKISKEAISMLAIVLGGLSLWLSISILVSAKQDNCKPSGKAWSLTIISGIILLTGIVTLFLSFRGKKTKIIPSA